MLALSLSRFSLCASLSLCVSYSRAPSVANVKTWQAFSSCVASVHPSRNLDNCFPPRARCTAQTSQCAPSSSAEVSLVWRFRSFWRNAALQSHCWSAPPSFAAGRRGMRQVEHTCDTKSKAARDTNTIRGNSRHLRLHMIDRTSHAFRWQPKVEKGARNGT